MTAQTAQQIPLSVATLEAPTVTAARLVTSRRLVALTDAQLSPDPTARLTTEALRTVTGLVPCRLAVLWSISRRLEVADAVVLEDASQTPATTINAGFYTARVRAVDPFAPSRAARLGAALLTVEDAGGALRFANSAYGRHLDRAGLEHQVSLYLRAAGGLRAMLVLLRARGAPAFDRAELRVLRLLHPLVEQGYACSLASSSPAEDSQTLPELTRREAEVAALIALGASNAEIATALNVEPATVKAHLTQIYAKFGVRTRTQLALRLAGSMQQAGGTPQLAAARLTAPAGRSHADAVA
jgi:DNA-binding CsgD family transcriptional regulator